MNREDVIQLAKQAGANIYTNAMVPSSVPEISFVPLTLERFANAIEQRTLNAALERAAAVCEARAQDHAKATGDCSYNDCDIMAEAIDCAAAIRALKDTP